MLDNTIDDDFITKLNAIYRERASSDTDLQLLISKLKRLKKQRNLKVISLNEVKRRKELTEADSLNASNSRLESIKYSIEGVSTTTSEKSLKLEDVYLEKGLLILADVVSLTDA